MAFSLVHIKQYINKYMSCTYTNSYIWETDIMTNNYRNWAVNFVGFFSIYRNTVPGLLSVLRSFVFGFLEFSKFLISRLFLNSPELCFTKAKILFFHGGICTFKTVSRNPSRYWDKSWKEYDNVPKLDHDLSKKYRILKSEPWRHFLTGTVNISGIGLSFTLLVDRLQSNSASILFESWDKAWLVIWME